MSVTIDADIRAVIEGQRLRFVRALGRERRADLERAFEARLEES